MRPGDTLTVHATNTDELVAPISEYEVIRDLPDPARAPRNALERAVRPAALALGRSRRRRELLRRGFDVAHIGNLWYETDCVDLRGLRRRVPLVCDVHDVRPHSRRVPGAVESTLLQMMYGSGAHLIVLHDVLKDEMLSEFRVDPERVHVVPHVLDATATRDSSLPEPSRPQFLIFGTLRANKGLDVLARVLRKISGQLDADVVIAGTGDQSIMRMLQETIGSAPNVTLELGRIGSDRKRTLFSSASWCVLPYLAFHSQSGVLADAYAYRVPLIVSDVGAIGPTVRDDATGIVVPSGDESALADALLRAAATPRSMLAEALDTAAQKHEVGVVGPKLRAIYELAADDQR
jgi:glycosyltransferase involved in cell wall biosynthesis